MIYRDQPSSPSHWVVPTTRHLVPNILRSVTRTRTTRSGPAGTNRRLEVRGPDMADTLAAIAIVVFAAGIIVGVIVIVSIGIQREERDFLKTGLISMTRRAPDRVSGGARSLTGLYVGQRTDSKPPAARYEDTLV